MGGRNSQKIIKRLILPRQFSILGEQKFYNGGGVLE
jgi:hypothetical protein